MYYPCSENKGPDQIRGYREADLCLCFRICKMLVFSQRGSNAYCNFQAELSLLMMEERDDSKKHFSLEKLIDDSSGKKKRKKKEKLEKKKKQKDEENFEVL